MLVYGGGAVGGILSVKLEQHPLLRSILTLLQWLEVSSIKRKERGLCSLQVKL